jgi:hypothetical protein
MQIPDSHFFLDGAARARISVCAVLFDLMSLPIRAEYPRDIDPPAQIVSTRL